MPESTSARAARPDYSTWLPVDAPVTGVATPEALASLLGALTSRSASLGISFSRSDAGFLLDPAFAPALGLDPGAPAWFSVRAGPVTRILQAGEDLSRVLQAPDQYTRWLADSPLPPAWAHVRLAATRAPPPSAESTQTLTPETWLGGRYGAVQVLGPADSTEMWAAALDANPSEVATALAGLAPLGDYRAFVLLEAHHPTAVVRSGSAPLLLVDWVQDLGFGRGGLSAGLAALTAGVTRPSGESGNDPVGVGRVSGALAAGEALRLNVAHGPFMRWSRAMAEVEVVARAAFDAALPVELRGAQLAEARRAAALPEQLLGPAALLFRASEVSVRATPELITVQIQAAYTSRGTKLATLERGESPVPLRSIAGAGPAAVSIATGPRHGPTFDDVAALPALPLDRFLAEVMRCGFVCWPALWSSVPMYARQPAAALGTVFPEVAGFAEPVAGTLGAAFIVETSPRPGFALATRPTRGLAETQARWRAAFPNLEQRALVMGGAGALPVLLIGNSTSALDRLTRSVDSSGAQSDALIDAEFAGPISTLFGRFGLRVSLRAEALEAHGTLALLPLAPPPEEEDAK